MNYNLCPIIAAVCKRICAKPMYFRGQSLEAPAQSPKRVLPIIDVQVSTSVKEASSHGLGEGVPDLFALV